MQLCLESGDLCGVVAELFSFLTAFAPVLDRLGLADFSSASRALTMLSRRASLTGSSSSARSWNEPASSLLASWVFAGGFTSVELLRGVAQVRLEVVDGLVECRDVDRLPELATSRRRSAPTVWISVWYSAFVTVLRAAAAAGEDDQESREAEAEGSNRGHRAGYPTEAGVRCGSLNGAEITPVEPDLVRTSEGSEP